MLSNLTHYQQNLELHIDTSLLSKSVQKKSTDYKGKWTDYRGKMDNSTQQTCQELHNLFSKQCLCPTLDLSNNQDQYSK